MKNFLNYNVYNVCFYSKEFVSCCRIYQKLREDGNYWLFVDYNTYKAADCELLLINNPLPAEMRKISIERIIFYIIIHLYKSNL